MEHSLKIRLGRSIAIFLTLLALPAAATTYYVDINSPNPTPPYTDWSTAATNIQNAIDAAINGDSVIVTDGVYQVGGETMNGSLLTNRVLINKNIIIQSVNGPTNTFINGSPVPTLFANNSIRCVCMTTNATLTGFTLMNGCTLSTGIPVNDQSGGGIWCASTNNFVISNCVIIANTSWYQGGGVYQGTLLNCTIISNTCYNGNGGGASSSTIFGSLIISNTAANSSNISADGGGVYNCAVFNSAIAGNSAAYAGGGAFGGTQVNSTIIANSAYYDGGGTANSVQTNCIIYYNQIFASAGAETNCDPFILNHCCTTPNLGGPGNITAAPQLADLAHISLNSPCRGAGNPLASTGTDIDGNPWNNPPSIGCSEIPPGGDYGNLVVNISTPFTNQAPNYPLNFKAAISGPDYTTVWNFGDGTIITNTPNLSHIWSAIGTYPVTLTAYNDSYPNGITVTQMITVSVPSTYYVNLANPNPTPPYSYWSTAATNIQDAVSVAVPGSLVLVTNPTVLVQNLEHQFSTNYIAIYQYNNGFTAPNGYPYCVCVTNSITIESVNGPAMTYIAGFQTFDTGCIYLTNGATLIGFTLTNGYGFDGAIYATSTNAVITNCIINHCSGAAQSGTLYNCLIENNQGGTYLSTLNNCILTNNTGSAAHGGILNNCTLINNTNSGGFGGAAYGDSASPIVLNNCMISNNTAESGGGVAGYNGMGVVPPGFTNCILNNCILVHNTATVNQGIPYGGGAFDAQLSNCLVSNNVSSGFGGGVAGGWSINCLIVSNVATSSGGGAASDFNNSFNHGFTILNNCSLIGNRSGSAGGAGFATLNQCTLLWNTAQNGTGGAAAASVLNNCLVISNSVAGSNPNFNYAGGIDNCSSTNCILAYNVATNGGGAHESTLVNCTVAYNSAQTGGGIAGCTADNCILYYNTGGDYGNNTQFFPPKGNAIYYCCTPVLPTNITINITSAPLFVNPSGNDFHLQSTSPCINSGNNIYITSPTDFDGNPRITGGTVDIGAYEYQTPTSVISYAWLQQYGLPTDGSVDFADLDGTGFNVYQDWIAGLNPTNSSSVLAMLPPASTNNVSGITVTWQSSSGILYNLQRSTNLSALPPFSTIQSNIVGQTGTTSYKDTSATNNSPYFYRVNVVAP